MNHEESACGSDADYPKESNCKCESTQNWVSMNPKAKLRKSQNSNTCAKREAEWLKLYEARVAALNTKERYQNAQINYGLICSEHKTLSTYRCV